MMNYLLETITDQHRAVRQHGGARGMGVKAA